MNDTSPEMEARYRQLLLARSGEERLAMASSMHGFAVKIVESGLREIDPIERRVEFFLRMYGSDFDASQRELFVSKIRGR